jgi:hypothetical protein
MIFDLPITVQDLFAIGSNSCFKGLKYYFDPTEFPFDGDFKNSLHSATKLFQRLFRCAVENGYRLVLNGCGGIGKGNKEKVLICNRKMVAKPTNSKSTGPFDFRSSSVKSDKRSCSRPEGRDLPRRKPSSRPASKTTACQVRLTLGVDSSGYYVFGGRGVREHTDHPKLLTTVVPLTSRELTHAEKENVGAMVRAGLTCSAASHLLKSTANVLLPRTSARHLSQALVDDYPPDFLPENKEKIPTTSTERLFRTLEEKKIDHIVLSSRGTADLNPGVGTSNFVSSAQSPTVDDFVDRLPPGDKVLMDAYVTKHRKSMKVSDAGDMFLAVVWMTPAERSIFRKFPFVVKIDVTFKTNVRGIPFLTMTGKTSDNEIFTILRCFVPNEQAWVFRWLLLHALPIILGKDLSRVQMIISDGDSQEIAQINTMIELVMKQALRQRCGWHVIDRSWNRYVYRLPKNGTAKTSKFQRRYAETSRRILFHWFYSFMTKGCETKEEYEVSKILLIHHLNSKELLKTLGTDLVTSVQEMYRKAVYPNEANFVFYRRRLVMAQEEYTNSTQEASFAAVKHGTLAVKASMDMDASLRQLTQQAEKSCVQYEATALARLTTNATWSTATSVVSLLTPFGGGLVEAEIGACHDYESGMAGPTEFRVLYSGGLDEEYDRVVNAPFISSFVPRFKRVRVVCLKVTPNGLFLVCNCGHFERTGIPCRHALHTRRKYWTRGSDLAITDVHPMWHATYKAYAFAAPDENGWKPAASAAVERYAKAFTSSVIGLRVTTRSCDLVEPVLEVPHVFEILPAADRCFNWPTKLIHDLSADSKACGLPSMSQQVNMYTQESEESDDDEEFTKRLSTDAAAESEDEDFVKRFSNDVVALQKQKQEKREVVASLIPLTKELMIAVEKAPHSLDGICEQLRSMIAKLNVADSDSDSDSDSNSKVVKPRSMAFPASKKRSRR